MEEIVDAFVRTRRDVLEFARTPPAVTTVAAPPESPKRKREDPSEDHDMPQSSQPANKRLRSSARLSKSRTTDAMAEMARQEADIIEDHRDHPEDYEPGTRSTILHAILIVVQTLQTK